MVYYNIVDIREKRFVAVLNSIKKEVKNIMRKRARNHKLLTEWNKLIDAGCPDLVMWYDGYWKFDPYYEPQGRRESRKLIPIQKLYRD